MSTTTVLDYKREMHEKVVWPTDQPNKNKE